MENKFIKYLGVDWGKKRIGIALGDNITNIATPFKVAHNINELIDIITKEEINKIIIGNPFKMAGIEEKTSNEFNDFLDLLKSKIKLPIELFDERLTSKAADALRGKEEKTNAPRDTVAAMLILQSYLDKIRV